MKIKIESALIAAALLAMVSCTPEETAPQQAYGPVSFSLQGPAPVVAYPDDNVHYNLSITYEEGISCVYASIDGNVLEGSKTDYTGEQTVSYNFGYTIDAANVGQTVDFVFTVEGTDGHVKSIDYPVYVKSISETVNISLPEDAPLDAIIGDLVEFDITVTTGYKISTIKTSRGGEPIESLTKTEGFTEPKMDTYHFSYLITPEDGGKMLSFLIEAIDEKGNFGAVSYELKARRGEPKNLYKEIFDTSINISSTSEWNTTAGGISGNAATTFIPANVEAYNGDNPDVVEGVKQGLTVYDGEISAIQYSTDGANICLSKYDYASMTIVSGTYVWGRKGTAGWLQVDGIRLHGCTDLTFSYGQCGGSCVVSYCIDGENWTKLLSNNKTSSLTTSFTVPEGTEEISIKFTENYGSAHLRLDNIQLIGE